MPRVRHVIALVPTALLLLLPDAANAAAILVVDDNMACAGAAFNTIQAAADAATAGDTVKVCAGSYPETVTVTKTLIFKGAKAGIDARTRANTGESVVQGAGGGFAVQANGVVIDGFIVKNATGPGIYLYGAHNGSTVTNNVIKNNTMGIYANSSGAGLTIVSLNLITDNNTDGSAAGNGIYSDQGLTGGRIKNNQFERNMNAGVLIAQTATTVDDLTVSGNRSVDNSSFVAIFHGTNVRVKGNITGDTNPADNEAQGSAIFIGGNTAGATVANNIVKNSPFHGIALRMTASGLTVQGNKIRNAILDGISVTTSTPGAATITANDVKYSGQNGIALRDSTTGNTITGNTSVLNSVSDVDCSDETLGEATAGTANTWTGNTGATSYPPGLCTSPGSFTVVLTGAAVPTGGDPDGTGTARLFLDSVAGRACYVLSWDSVDGTVDAAHIHNAPAGQVGPHAVDLFNSASHPGTGAAKGCRAASPSQLSSILAAPAQYYVNLHSTSFPLGALRGQLG